MGKGIDDKIDKVSLGSQQQCRDEIFPNKGDISYVKWPYTPPSDRLFFTDWRTHRKTAPHGGHATPRRRREKETCRIPHVTLWMENR